MNYEKKYKEALEKARQFSERPLEEDSSNIVEYIFPELKESDDEKIRKELIQYIKNWKANIQGKAYTYLWSSDKEECNKLLAWLEKQGDKDKLIQELGEYKVKYTQEVLEKHVNNMSNKDDERLRKTTISFLKDFAKQGYENAVECIDWLEKQGEQKSHAWSEKDEGYKLVALSAFLNYYDEENPLRKCLINWLKSLKQRMGG